MGLCSREAKLNSQSDDGWRGPLVLLRPASAVDAVMGLARMCFRVCLHALVCLNVTEVGCSLEVALTVGPASAMTSIQPQTSPMRSVGMISTSANDAEQAVGGMWL